MNRKNTTTTVIGVIVTILVLLGMTMCPPSNIPDDDVETGSNTGIHSEFERHGE